MPEEAREFRWPIRKLAGDYARGVLGVLVAAMCAVLAPAGSWWQIILIVLLLLFLTFLVDVMIKHVTRVVMTPKVLGRRRLFWREDQVAWDDIQGLDVRFYAARRDRTSGWMTAKIKGSNGSISLDDGMSGFEDVMDRAMQAMEARGLEVNESTAANLASLGLGLRQRATR